MFQKPTDIWSLMFRRLVVHWQFIISVGGWSLGNKAQKVVSVWVLMAKQVASIYTFLGV